MNDYTKYETKTIFFKDYIQSENYPTSSKCLCLIPARGGSKGVERKNIKKLNKTPLISYSIKSALEATLIDDIIVSTEDAEIARISVEEGASVPFLRPSYLSNDHSYLEDAYLYTLSKLKEIEGKKYDTLAILEATQPFRPSGLIDSMIQFLFDEKLDTVLLITPNHSRYWRQTHFGWQRTVKDEEPYGNRQYKEPSYREVTGTLITRPEVIENYRARVGKKVGFFIIEDSYATFDIDSEHDFMLAEKIYGL